MHCMQYQARYVAFVDPDDFITTTNDGKLIELLDKTDPDEQYMYFVFQQSLVTDFGKRLCLRVVYKLIANNAN